MARFAAALLGGGANEHGRVLSPGTLRTMFGPHYQPDPRIPGMGPGFFRDDARGHPTVGLDGIWPGPYRPHSGPKSCQQRANLLCRGQLERRDDQRG